jgi:sulfate adenylyltransferase
MGDSDGKVIITLEGDDLDRLELSLAGFTPTSALHFLHPGVSAECSDPEGTPIATWDGLTLLPLRPLAGGIGLAWKEKYRRSALEITAKDGSLWMLPFSRPLSIEEISSATEKMLSLARPGATRMLLVPLVSREAAAAGELTANTLVAVAKEIQTHVHEKLPAIVCDILALPWPRNTPPIIEDIAMRLHASVITPDAPQRSPSDKATYLPRANVAMELSRKPLTHGGVVIFFTGLSGSGKSTIARGLAESLGDQHANVALLDGDSFRRKVSQHLGFDRASRNQNIVNIASAALEAARTGAIAIAAPIAPFTESRAEARSIVSAEFPFFLIHVSTPLEVCEQRDRKGLYAKARRGEVSDFTGISSPYEAPTDADLTIDASSETTSASVERILKLVLPNERSGD